MNEGTTPSDNDLVIARQEFRMALRKTHETRKDIGEVEAAAARFCQVLRRKGHTPEAMLIDAKQVIAEAIDGESKPIAERAILSCIQHYYAT
ncbi:MAG: hypothetical protein JWL61_4618 [Gemmatimonadetes bacterium]|jgi:hypothetical protein|nr:hypothetical protein [Gemmatimonadota bacterium]